MGGGGGAHESKQCTKTMENMKRYLKKKNQKQKNKKKQRQQQETKNKTKN